MYVLTGLGITVGFHRLLTHRSFKTTPVVAGVFAALGSAAIEGPVISWVADHRKHHAFSDRPGDPHSPHVDHGSGWRGALTGLAHAHVGWLFLHTHRGRRSRYAPDLLEDPVVSAVDRASCSASSAGSSRPSCSARLRRHAARRAHRPAVGRRRARARPAPRDVLDQLALPLLRPPPRSPTKDESRNLLWLALRSPSARPGTTTTTPSRPRPRTACARWQLDPSAWVIWALEKCGLAWDVVRIPPERQAGQEVRRGGLSTRPAARRAGRGPARASLPRHLLGRRRAARYDQRRRRPDLLPPLAARARPHAARAEPARPRPRLRGRRPRRRRHRRDARAARRPTSPPPVDATAKARIAAAAVPRRRAQAASRASPAVELRPQRPPPLASRATARRSATTTTSPTSSSSSFLGRVDDLLVRALVAAAPRRWRRRRPPSTSSSARSSALQPGERVLDVGCGWGSFAVHAAHDARRPRHRHHAVRAAGRRARASAPRGAGVADRSRSASPTTATCAARRSTRSRQHRHGRARRQR